MDALRTVIRRVGGLEVPALAVHTYKGVIRRVGGLEGAAVAAGLPAEVIRRVGGLEVIKSEWLPSL